MNSDNEYVPGPWAVFPKAPGEYEYLKDHVMTASKPHIRICNVYGGLEYPRGLANARLIAAAPEMMNILERIANNGIYIEKGSTKINYDYNAFCYEILPDLIVEIKEIINRVKTSATLPQN